MADAQDPREPMLGRVGGFLNRRPWYKLPDILAMPRLVEIRNELRAKNLHDTDEPKATASPIPPDLDPKLRDERTIEGTWNDLKFPQMGCAGRRSVHEQFSLRAMADGLVDVCTRAASP